MPLDWHAGLRIAFAMRDLRRFEAARAVYLPEGLPPAPNQDGSQGHLPLGRLAETLERIAAVGPNDLLTGELARLLVEDVRAAGGVLTLADLEGYQARAVAPLAIRHGDAVIQAAPGLSAGPSLGHALGLVAGRVPPGRPGAAAYVAWAEALLAAYERRLATLGAVDDARDPGCTTHLAVVDRAGTMVSLTQTLLSLFGSKVVSPQTGILLNNGIMWFDPRPGRPNSMVPGKRPLANMCPVIASRHGRPWLALGASGGRRILPAVLQIASMLIDGGLDLESAFHEPRIDVSGEPHVTADRRLAPDVLAALAARCEVHSAATSAAPQPVRLPDGGAARPGQRRGARDDRPVPAGRRRGSGVRLVRRPLRSPGRRARARRRARERPSPPQNCPAPGVPLPDRTELRSAAARAPRTDERSSMAASGSPSRSIAMPRPSQASV